MYKLNQIISKLKTELIYKQYTELFQQQNIVKTKKDFDNLAAIATKLSSVLNEDIETSIRKLLKALGKTHYAC